MQKNLPTDRGAQYPAFINNFFKPVIRLFESPPPAHPQYREYTPESEEKERQEYTANVQAAIEYYNSKQNNQK